MTSAICKILEELERSRFYGAVEIKYEAGRIVIVRKTESIKLADKGSDFRNNRGNQNDKPNSH